MKSTPSTRSFAAQGAGDGDEGSCADRIELGARIVEIQKADAVRLYGQTAVWKDVGQRLLDDTCQVRTGWHEEDGCWPSFE